MMVDSTMTCAQLRQWAWNGLWKGCWFWKILALGILFGFIQNAAMLVLNVVFALLGGERFASAGATGVAETFSPGMTGAMLVQSMIMVVVLSFVALILSGISSYGLARASLDCARGGRPDWFGRAFAGFKRPLSLAWLFLQISVICLGWALLGLAAAGLIAGAALGISIPLPVVGAVAAIPFLAAIAVPFYRYRFAFLVQADFPELPGREVLRRTRELMKGNMGRSFALDCSYWLTLLFPFVMVVIVAACVCAGIIFKEDSGLSTTSAAVLALAVIVSCIVFAASVRVAVVYIKMGQTGLYLAISQNSADANAE